MKRPQYDRASYRQHQSRQMLQWQEEDADYEDKLLARQNPLIGLNSSVASLPSVNAHVALLQRLTTLRSEPSGQLLLQLQRQYGNRYVERVVALSRQTKAQEATNSKPVRRVTDLSLQRQPDPPWASSAPGVLPAVPRYQLTPPSLLSPPEPSLRYGLGQEFQLHLNPEIQAMAMQALLGQMEPANLRTALSQVNLNLTSLPAVSTPPPNPFALPSLPPSPPLVPRGAGPSPARSATVGDLMQAVMAVPMVDAAITNLRTQATDRLQRDWRDLSTGNRIAVISTGVLLGSGAIAGVLSNPETRQLAQQFALSQLNGHVFTVPRLDWLGVEMNLSGNNLMLGFHADIGKLLPPSLGFGPASFTAIGAPPQPQPFIPGGGSVQPKTIQRACAGGTWQFEYDGCSVPAWISSLLGINKDNPAGGRDTQFAFGIPTSRGGRACDRHDECYQTCGADKARCDIQMYDDMMAICNASTESYTRKQFCYDWAHLYWNGLFAGGGSAYRERQQQTCRCRT